MKQQIWVTIEGQKENLCYNGHTQKIGHLLDQNTLQQEMETTRFQRRHHF
jgi:hypothetical protein